MRVLNQLHNELKMLEKGVDHNGYFYSISDTLMIMVCGIMCGFRSIDGIHAWAKSIPVRKFLKEQLKIEKICSRAQFYNIINLADEKKFKLILGRWMHKTYGSAGDQISEVYRFLPSRGVLHIANAMVTAYKPVRESTVYDVQEMMGLPEAS